MYEQILHALYIYSLQDIVEIFIFSIAFYAFSIWLIQDKQKNLLPYLYLSCSAVLTCTYFNLATLTTFFFLYWPGLMMLFVLTHQRTLQKNFVTLRNIKPAELPKEDWIETMIRSSFIAASKNKEVLFIIENNDSLQEHMHCPIRLKTQIQSELLDILLDSSAFNSGNGVWINAHGMVLGIDVTWQALTLPAGTKNTKELWHEQALALSSLADSLVCKLNLKTRMFDVIGQGTLIEDSPTDSTIQIIKQYIKQHYKPLSKRKDYHESNYKKSPPISPAP
ncbi:hypothetical protein A3F06_01720 [candidate division TM6 bacterium RIFCSPHIGHO2_12_FULL_36_22]|nr:MAG: hypothetical protein A3F06_01720 [candidate division TM6 bacterium RIFCSPHIGHO2_12_FULL_36_22]